MGFLLTFGVLTACGGKVLGPDGPLGPDAGVTRVDGGVHPDGSIAAVAPIDPAFDPGSGKYDPTRACGELVVFEPADHHGHHAHPDDPTKAGEHSAAMQLLLPADATHVASRSGYWSDKAIWAGGEVPGHDADVHIPAGICVIYSEQSDTALHYLRVDGGLVFSSHDNTRMVVDTIIGGVSSLFKAGAINDPVEPGLSTEIVIANNGPIDPALDPKQLSRGLVLHGTVLLHGAKKAAYLPLDLPANSGAKRLEAGTSQITLAGDMTNWQVGDQLVVMGTDRGDYQDELRTIAAIDGQRVTLDEKLDFLHDTPRFQTTNVTGLDELHIYVGNATRNVTIRSEHQNFSSPDDVKRRGHFMVMHADGADIRYAGFHHLGRTDKRIPINDALHPGDRNPEGRYPLHFHRTGVGTNKHPFACIGNAVTHSPGWGITHHDSYGAVNWNFVYDIVGAGIVSEDGNEVGEWIGNFVTSIYGDGGKHGDGGDGGRSRIDQITVQKSGDAGFAGVAYESQSRVITQQDNIAANARVGWSFLGIATNLGHNGDLDPVANHPDQPYIKNPETITAFDPNPLQVQFYHLAVRILGPMSPQFMQFRRNQMIAIDDKGLISWHRGSINEFALLNQVAELIAWRVDEVFYYDNYWGGYHHTRSLFVEVGTAMFTRNKNWSNHFVANHFERVNRVMKIGAFNNEGVLFNNTEVAVNGTLDGTEVETEMGRHAISIPPNSVVRFANPTAIVRPVGDFDAYKAIPHPTIDLIEPDGPLDASEGFTLQGTITDRFGERAFATTLNFHSNRLAGRANAPILCRRPGSPGENGWVFPGGKFMQYTTGSLDWAVVLDMYGAIRKDGVWVMPIPIWINDLGDGEPYPVLYDFRVSRASEQDLREHELSAYPTVDLTGTYYGNPNVNADGSFKPTRVYARRAWRVPIADAQAPR